MTRLVHPETGGSFDAAERAVQAWLRAGWTRPADLPDTPPQGGTVNDQSGGGPAGTDPAGDH